MADNSKGNGDERAGEQRASELWRLLNDPGRMIDDELNLTEPTQSPPAEAPASPREARPSYLDEPRPDGYEDADVAAMEARIAESAVAEPAVDAIPSDFDPAVQGYVQEETLSVQCKNHPQTAAVAVCPVCEAYFCQPCLIIHRGRLICRDCRDTLAIRSEEEVLAREEFGYDEEEVDFVEKEKPEFQISGEMFGLEGHPAHPIKKLIAYLIDMLVVRGTVLVLLFAVDPLMSSASSPVFHLLDPGDGFDSPGPRIAKALLLMLPLYPWLFVLFTADFLYYFFSLAFANRTLGMSWSGCRIVTEWGDFVPFGQVALWTLVFNLLLGWPAIVASWFFPAFRGPHDYTAGTVVINYDGVKRIDAYETVQIRL
jgi:uncharacterized RDD family membrane protein YckC